MCGKHEEGTEDMVQEFMIGSRKIGVEHPPLVIAEIGINHEGDFGKEIRMIDDAKMGGMTPDMFSFSGRWEVCPP